MDFFIAHLVGDYLLQNDWMAMNKKKPSWFGFLTCFVHCLIYTVLVMLFTGWWKADNYALIWGLVFLSHWVFDRTYLALKWMDLYGSWKRMSNDDPNKVFAYIWVDNSFHLILLWLISKFIA